MQDAILASKRRIAPHIVAPIRRFATSKLASQYLDTLLREQASLDPSAAAGVVTSAAAGGGAAGTSATAGATASNSTSSAATSSSSSSNSSSGAPGVASALAAGIIRMPEFLVPNDVISAVITQVKGGFFPRGVQYS